MLYRCIVNHNSSNKYRDRDDYSDLGEEAISFPECKWIAGKRIGV